MALRLSSTSAGIRHEDRMRALRLNEQDIMAAARQRGLRKLEDVRYAISERDGKIAILEEKE